MAKQIKKPIQQSTPKTAREAKPQTGTGLNFMALAANLGGGLLAAVVILMLFQHQDPDPTKPTSQPWNSGYDWLLNTMLENNLKTIEEHPNANMQERYELKWGAGEVSYVNRIKKETNDSSIILFPPKKMLVDVGFKSYGDAPWLVYFLYPRKIAYDDDTATAINKSKATHLVSLNGWGFDKLNYQVEKPESFMVLPIKK